MRFFSWWAEIIVRRPVWVISVCFLLMTGFSVAALLAPKDLSFTGMLDEKDPELIRYRSAIRTFGGTAALVILLEGDADLIEDAAAKLVRELPEKAPVRNIVPPADPQWILDRAPWLWPDPLFEGVLRELNGRDSPAEPESTRSVASPAARMVEGADRMVRERLRPSPNALLISMSFTSDIFDMAMGGRDYQAVTAAVDEILEGYSGRITADYTGIAAIGAQDQNSVFGRVKIITPITLILVLALLYSVERRFSRILAAGFALGGSVGMTFGLVSLILGKLSITATFFGMLLLGLGIDFAIHLLVAMRDAHSHGASPADSVRRGLHVAGPAILMGGLTTTLATGVLIFVPQPGAIDMGLTATLGLAVALIFMLSFLPAAWLIIETRWGHSEPPPRLVLPGIHTSVVFSIAHPRLVLFLAAIVTAIGLVGLPRYQLESDLQHIMSRDVPALDVDKRIQELFGIAPVSYLAPVETLEEAEQLAKEMVRLPDIAAVNTPSSWIVADMAQRERRMRETLASAPASPLAIRLQTALEAGPVSLDTLPLSLRAGLIAPDGRLAIQIIPEEALLDAKDIQAQIGRLREIAPDVTGIPVVALRLMTGTQDWIPRVLAAIAFVVCFVLFVSFRNIRDVMLAFVPVIVGSVVSLGAFFLLDLKFSLLTGIVVPVILGLGIDDGIHIVERLRRIGRIDDTALVEAVEGVGRAIFLTSATTTLSFVGLFFCRHFGLESMAQFMSMGVPLCFVASITVLPAAVVLIRRDGKGS